MKQENLNKTVSINYKYIKYTVAFTLSEVLITLGIIGIVAAMTLPTLVGKYKEKQTVAKVKVAYTIFNEAFQRAINENGSIENWGLSNLVANVETGTDKNGNQYPIVNYGTEENIQTSKILFEAISPYLKLIKSCKDNEEENCVSNGDSWDKSDTNSAAQKMNFYSGILSNGISFYIFGRSGNCDLVVGTNKQLKNVCASLTVDIDGKNRGKTRSGSDLFRFWITKYGISPVGTAEDNLSYTIFETNCAKKGSGESCTAWVILNENMDYLHCKDLSWNKKIKCDK